MAVCWFGTLLAVAALPLLAQAQLSVAATAAAVATTAAAKNGDLRSATWTQDVFGISNWVTPRIHASADWEAEVGSGEHNVIVRLCVNEENYGYPLSHPANANFTSTLKGWFNLTQRIYIWNYVGGAL